MLFSNAVMYFIIMSTGATLHAHGQTNIETAAQAAEALRPLAGAGGSLLFAVGIIGVGFLAVPVMTAGAAYDLTQAFGWTASLHARPGEAPKFYWAIAAITAIAVVLNFLGVNQMRALVWSGIVQGFSTPPLLLLIMFMTNNRRIMGNKVNSAWMNALGWMTTAAVFSASAGLVVTWFL
jgi:Mn2+/Fe2+ NRAMP family transporter